MELELFEGLAVLKDTFELVSEGNIGSEYIMGDNRLDSSMTNDLVNHFVIALLVELFKNTLNQFFEVYSLGLRWWFSSILLVSNPPQLGFLDGSRYFVCEASIDRPALLFSNTIHCRMQ
jgi:hypothetical protein